VGGWESAEEEGQFKAGANNKRILRQGLAYLLSQSDRKQKIMISSSQEVEAQDEYQGPRILKTPSVFLLFHDS
jgi:hypothetical protein